MKIIYNRLIPFSGFKAINLFGVIFVREEYKNYITDIDINHECIHSKQAGELLFIFYYIIYLLEWLFRVLFTKDKFSHKAYKNISFEQEAYKNQYNLEYLNNRKYFAQWR